jgi:hypothetical protein
MQIFDVRILEGVPFDEYLKLPGTSFSTVRGFHGVDTPTKKMKFGSRVHTYLLEPEKYDGVDYRLVRPVAQKLKDYLGVLLKHGKFELTVLCTMVHNGYYLYYRGRIDVFAGGMVIDLKVSNLNILKAINHFKYNHQLNGYAIAISAKASILFSINPETLNIQTAPIPTEYDFWQQQVLTYGKPI